MEAIISECGSYRYVLKRKTNCPLRWIRPCLFIMLNPSIADDKIDDPTIRRCISFAERAGCTTLTVVNLFALRSTDPKELGKHPDPIGPENDKHILDQVKLHQLNGLIVAAWGSSKFAKGRDKKVLELTGPIKCLGMTKDGSPRHPLYIRSDQDFIELK